jgi:hypothetical protein
MYEFLVLGIIPGTDIQITFADWLLILAAVITSYLAVKTIRNKLLLKAQLLYEFLILSRRPLQA